jgi:hypothetical protein
MSAVRSGRLPVCLLSIAVFLTGCRRAPSFDVMGSFFPAWLVCAAAGILATVLVRFVFVRLRIPLAFPAVTYPCLTALCTFVLWLAFFR